MFPMYCTVRFFFLSCFITRVFTFLLYVDFKDNLVSERCILNPVAWNIICECFIEMTKVMKWQSEMEHVKEYKIAENLSKQNKVSAFYVSTFKRLRRSTLLTLEFSLSICAYLMLQKLSDGCLRWNPVIILACYCVAFKISSSSSIQYV